jgi:sulfate permease
LIELFAILIALVFALTIGASGTAAAMSSAYGSGAIRARAGALGLVAVAFVLGAVLAGAPVARTLGGGLVGGADLSVALVLVVLLSATLPLIVATLVGLPLSTSAVTVGAIIGLGLAVQQLDYGLLALIVAAWLAMPFVAFALTALISRFAGMRLESKLWNAPSASLIKLLGLLLVGSGVFVAFAVGANNVANAVGPLINAEVVSSRLGLLVGGFAVGAGALLLGHRVLETSAKQVTNLSLVSGTVVNAVSGLLVLIAALMGIPVPIVQSTAAGIMGVGFARRGRHTLRKQVVRDMVTVWVVSPVVSLVLAYLLAHFIVDTPVLGRALTYPLLIVGGVVIGLTMLLINRSRLVQSLSWAKPMLQRVIVGTLRLI